MAVFTIAKTDDGNTAVYRTEEDLRELLFCGYNHSCFTVMENLYPLGVECICEQFLYLQWRRGKLLNTKALHYILSFNTQSWKRDVETSQISSIMRVLINGLFQEYQRIFFLHMDNPTLYHIHIIVNPVNRNTLRVCRDSWEDVGCQIAGRLGSVYDIPVQPFTQRDCYGVLRPGKRRA